MLTHTLLLPEIMKPSALFMPPLVRIALALFILVAMLYFVTTPTPDQTKSAQVLTPDTASAKPDPSLANVIANPQKRTEQAFLNDAMCKEMELGLGNDPAQFQQKWTEAQTLAKGVVEKMIEQAINSADLQQRAAALFMHAKIQTQKIPQEFKQKYPQCVDNPTCLQQMEAATTAVQTKDFNEIAKLAISSRDPQLYATAFHGCNALELAPQRVEGSEVFCQQISASQWALRDPENGFAWMYAAKQAGNKNTDVDNAMFHLSHAKIFDQRLLGLPQLQAGFKLAQQNGFVQLELGTLNNSVYSLRGSPPYKLMTDYCQPESLTQSNRRQICEGMAEKLLHDQANPVSPAIAAELAEKLAWPPEKTAIARLEQDAISGLVDEIIKTRINNANAIPNKTLQSCQDDARWAKSTLHAMEFGEMDQWRKKLANQSRTKTVLAARFHEDFAKDMNKAAAPGNK